LAWTGAIDEKDRQNGSEESDKKAKL